MPNRLTDVTGMTWREVFKVLTNNHSGSVAVLTECWKSMDALSFVGFLSSIDKKRLYDERIWELFVLCGKNIERFIYHVDIELPNQETGEWMGTTGPHNALIENPAFIAARQFGRPGSFWALKHPPTDPNYEYPILDVT